jgi:hypothetical protein
MLDLQHQYNNCTTIPHMRVGPTYWGLPSCEGLLCSCCIGVVQESNPVEQSQCHTSHHDVLSLTCYQKTEKTKKNT